MVIRGNMGALLERDAGMGNWLTSAVSKVGSAVKTVAKTVAKPAEAIIKASAQKAIKDQTGIDVVLPGSAPGTPGAAGGVKKPIVQPTGLAALSTPMKIGIAGGGLLLLVLLLRRRGGGSSAAPSSGS